MQDFLRAELIATVHNGDVLGDVRQVQRFFDRGIAATDDANILIFIEKAVAGRAAGHTLTHELLF